MNCILLSLLSLLGLLGLLGLCLLAPAMVPAFADTADAANTATANGVLAQEWVADPVDCRGCGSWRRAGGAPREGTGESGKPIRGEGPAAPLTNGLRRWSGPTIARWERRSSATCRHPVAVKQAGGRGRRPAEAGVARGLTNIRWARRPTVAARLWPAHRSTKGKRPLMPGAAHAAARLGGRWQAAAGPGVPEPDSAVHYSAKTLETGRTPRTDLQGVHLWQPVGRTSMGNGGTFWHSAGCLLQPINCQPS
jgi:hypothetical protein